LKYLLFAVGTIVPSLGLAQTWSPNLPDANFVAKNVDEVSVSPEGRAVAFLQSDPKGTQIGIYDVERDESKSLLQIENGTTIEGLTWLAGGMKLLVFLRTPSRVNLHLLDAPSLSQSQAWTAKMAAGHTIDIHITSSPVLEHALVWIVTSPPPESSAMPSEERWILPSGAKSLIYHPDLDRACADGYYFTGWSSSGTAILSNQGTARGYLNSLFRDGDEQVAEPQTVVAHASNPDSAWTRESSPFPLFMAATPGDIVLECMPSTGALRQVKLQKTFQQKTRTRKFHLQSLPQSVRAGSSESKIQTLWMSDAQKSGPAVLLAPDAQKFWLPQSETGIAFLWNRILFYRPFLKR